MKVTSVAPMLVWMAGRAVEAERWSARAAHGIGAAVLGFKLPVQRGQMSNQAVRLAATVTGAALIASFCLAGCAASVPAQSAPTTTVPPNVEALGDPPPGAAGEMLCQTGGIGGGAYYLLATSMTGRSTAACDASTAFDGGQEMLEAMPGPPVRRCVLDVDRYQAVVTVYSDDRIDDRRAAMQRCQEPGASP